MICMYSIELKTDMVSYQAEDPAKRNSPFRQGAVTGPGSRPTACRVLPVSREPGAYLLCNPLLIELLGLRQRALWG